MCTSVARFRLSRVAAQHQWSQAESVHKHNGIFFSQGVLAAAFVARFFDLTGIPIQGQTFDRHDAMCTCAHPVSQVT
jgi:hypothetical protein